MESGGRELTFAEAMAETLRACLAADERLVVVGGGFAGLTPAARYFAPLLAEFPDRFLAPPIAELGIAGMGAGAAMAGLRPIVDLGTGSFAFEAFPAIVNEAAIAYYTSNGQTAVPVLYHLHSGIRGAGAAQHSHAPHALFWQTPGLQIMLPSAPAEVKGLLRWALLRSRNPTIFVNHYRLLDERGPVPEGDYEIPFGRARVVRPGRDVTLIACGVMVPRALAAAETLAAEGIDAEVVDPRTLVPLDLDTLLASVRKTGRVVTADETPRSCGVAGELLARVCEAAWDALKAPPRRVAIPDVPIPFAAAQEEYVTPTAARLVEAARAVCGRAPAQ
jgi:pyruvate dehydrogenase E1 component beta subunit